MLRLSARSAQHYMEVLFVIRQKNCQPHKNQQRVTGKGARLQEADRKAEKLRQLGTEIQQAIDNPLVPPHGKGRAEAGEPAGSIHADAVDDLGVELAERCAEVLGAVHEEGIVNLVDVVLVEEDFVEAAHSAGDEFRSEALGAVELIGEPDAGDGNGDGGKHQEVFGWSAALLWLLSFFNDPRLFLW